MPGDPLRAVSPGDNLRATIGSAATVNALLDSARWVRDHKPRPDPPPGRAPVPALEVLVRNDSGGDLDGFSVVVLQPAAVVDPADFPYDVQQRPVFSAAVPDGDGPTRQLAVLSEPVPADQFGRAVIAGHTLARVQLAGRSSTFDDYPEYARPIPGDATRLASSPGGPVRIVRRPTDAFGSTVLCQVELGLDCADGWVAYGHGLYGDANTWPHRGDGNAQAWLTETVALLTEPGYYELALPVSARLDPNDLAGILTASNGLTYRATAYALLAAGPPAGGGVEGGVMPPLCAAHSFAVPSTSLTLFRRLTARGAGSATLTQSLRLTKDQVPYDLKVTYLGVSEGDFGGTPPRFGSLWRYWVGRGQLNAVRLPGVVVGSLGGCAVGGWNLIPVSQPSPPACLGEAEAFDDAYSVPAGGVLLVKPPGVLANDVFPAGYTAVLDAQPQYGTLAFNADGSFTYNQNVPLTGHASPLLDTFTYHLANAAGATSNVATVTISIVQGGGSGFGQFAPLGAGGAVLGTSGGTGGTFDPGSGGGLG